MERTMSKQHKGKNSKSVLKLATVGYLWRGSTAKYRRMMQPEKKVPHIRLSGLWLREYGFEIGEIIEIRAKVGRLVLIAKTIDDDLKNQKMGTA
jgi:hypothetical protein